MFDFGIHVARAGYRIAYRRDETNHCPGCGKAHWLLGRLTAECAFCGTALPLHGAPDQGDATPRLIHASETATNAFTSKSIAPTRRKRRPSPLAA